MAIGILSAGTRNDADPALAVLSEHIEASDPLQKIACITGSFFTFSYLLALLYDIARRSHLSSSFII